MQDIILTKFQNAEKLYLEGKYEQAAAIFLDIQTNRNISPFCFYYLARISNALNDPETAYSLFYKAFESKPDICSNMSADNKYVFKGKKEEIRRTSCFLCGKEAKPRWCYILAEAVGYNSFFNPVRMWMHCSDCNHMFAREFPEKLFIHNDSPRRANPQFFAYYSDILSKIRMNGFANGFKLFEVGIGACECMLAAREIGFDVFGIDVIERHVEDAKNKYALNAQTADFIEFDSDEKWNIIIMGDVIEHVSDPIAALKKAESMLNDDGALWVSTPNFESAFSIVVKHDDPMKMQQYHLNYFSRDSFYKILDECGFIPVDYKISAHYNGSMEIIAVKKSRI
ncbi:MAG: class I SAM-dependent methyltransferase [Oscillospiraceae bacterium]|nr:class I SAM-dependent methyltransferase [Oscillospiraceae bacterium]